MRIFRLIEMALLAIIISVNLTACSDDDKDVNSNSLEGTWGLTHIIEETGEEYEYDPYNPTPNTDDELKIVFKKTGNNSYTMDLYNPANAGNWGINRKCNRSFESKYFYVFFRRRSTTNFNYSRTNI